MPHELTEQNRKNWVGICKQDLLKFKSKKYKLSNVMTGDKCLLDYRYICKNKSTQRCVGEGLNLKNTVWRHKIPILIAWSCALRILVIWLNQGHLTSHPDAKSLIKQITDI